MATPADQRLLDLLEKWIRSLELHLEYAALDDASYAKVQPWPRHQRPSRWIIDLAKQKAIALQSQVRERVGQGDATFSESLELMTFLANLVGAEHIERFIPLASSADERAANAAQVAQVAATGTREMPAFVPDRQRQPGPAAMTPEAVHDQVIADAARLVQWGRKWYELAELISGMADRPSLIDVRRILKDNKAVIDKKAGRS